MLRKLRIEYPGAIYHVMSRGDRREAIFLDDVDRLDFLKTLAEAKRGQRLMAFSLAPCISGVVFPVTVAMDSILEPAARLTEK